MPSVHTIASAEIVRRWRISITSSQISTAVPSSANPGLRNPRAGWWCRIRQRISRIGVSSAIGLVASCQASCCAISVANGVPVQAQRKQATAPTPESDSSGASRLRRADRDQFAASRGYELPRVAHAVARDRHRLLRQSISAAARPRMKRSRLGARRWCRVRVRGASECPAAAGPGMGTAGLDQRPLACEALPHSPGRLKYLEIVGFLRWADGAPSAHFRSFEWGLVP